MADACRRIGVTEQSYYRWRKEHGGLKMDQAHRMKELEKENARPRRAVSERRVRRVLGRHRSTRRKAPRGADDEAALTEDILLQGKYKAVLPRCVGQRSIISLCRDSDHCNDYQKKDTTDLKGCVQYRKHPAPG